MSTRRVRSWLARGLRWRRRILGLALVLAVASSIVATRVPVEWVPSLGLPTVQVTAAWPGASPRDVERHVTAPIERALRAVHGGGEIESVSRRGMALIVLELRDRQRMAVAIAEIADRLAALRPSLPAGVVPRLQRQIPEELVDEQGFMGLELVGDASPLALRRLATDVVAPRLASLSGLAQVEVIGGVEEEVEIRLDPARMQRYGLDAVRVRDSIAEALEIFEVGRLADGDRKSAVRTVAVDGVEALARWGVAQAGGEPPHEDDDGAERSEPRPDHSAGTVVRLADVADIERVAAPSASRQRVDGRSVVGLRLDRQPNSHLLATAAAVTERLDTLVEILPPGVEVRVVDDRAADVRTHLHSLALRGGAGLCLVLAVLLSMLRTLRGVATVIASVGLALTLSIGAMVPLGLSFNLLTLAGLVLVVGLLVDNAVVVAERLERLPPGAGVDHASRAIADVATPLIGGTVTTIAVLVPLVWASGALRALFVPFAILVSLTLTMSLLSALVVVPLWIPLGNRGGGSASRSDAMTVRRRRGLARQLAEGMTRLAGRRPWVALVLIALLFGLPWPLLPERIERPSGGFDSPADEEVAERYNAIFGSSAFGRWRQRLEPWTGGVATPFLNDVELGQSWRFAEWPELRVDLRLPRDVGLDRLGGLIGGFEHLALASSSVRRTLVDIVGERATLRVQFVDGAGETLEPLRLRRLLIDRAMQLAGLEVAVTGWVPQGYYSGVGTASGFTIEAVGPSHDRLRELGDALAERLGRDRRVAAVDTDAGRSGRWPAREVVHLVWDRDAIAAGGVDIDRLADALTLRSWRSAPDFEADLDGRRLAVRVTVAGADALPFDRLLAEPLRLDGSVLRPAELARVERATQPRSIERRDQRYRRWIRVYYQGPPDLAHDSIDEAIRALDVPVGYEMERRAGVFFSAGVQRQAVGLAVGTMLAVILVLAVAFESWRLPWLVMASVPLAAIGVGGAFLITAAPFAEGAFLGLLLLVGVAVNDGILLVDRFRRLCNQRPHGDRLTLVRLAVRHRLHPMWTTTATSLAAMMPMLWLPEQGDFWFGLAAAVVGGVLVSTLTIPLAVVALVALFDVPRTRRPDAAL